MLYHTRKSGKAINPHSKIKLYDQHNLTEDDKYAVFIYPPVFVFRLNMHKPLLYKLSQIILPVRIPSINA